MKRCASRVSPIIRAAQLRLRLQGGTTAETTGGSGHEHRQHEVISRDSGFGVRVSNPGSRSVMMSGVSLTRRQFIWTAAASSLALPLWAGRSEGHRPAVPRFQHGVASGDPLGDRIILWTRVTPRDPSVTQPISIRWRIGTDAELRQRRVERDGGDRRRARLHRQGRCGRPGARHDVLLRVRCRRRAVGDRPDEDVSRERRGTHAELRSCPARTTRPASSTSTRCIARPDRPRCDRSRRRLHLRVRRRRATAAGAAINRIPQPPREAVTLRRLPRPLRDLPDRSGSAGGASAVPVRRGLGRPRARQRRVGWRRGQSQSGEGRGRLGDAQGRRATRPISSGCRFGNRASRESTSIAHFASARWPTW